MQEISIDYYRMDRKWVTHRLRPASVLFSDYYFYLIAFLTEGKTEKKNIIIPADAEIIEEAREPWTCGCGRCFVTRTPFKKVEVPTSNRF